MLKNDWLIYGPFCNIFCSAFIREVNGIENIPNGASILASNHSSFLDIPALTFGVYKLTKRKVRYIAKKELFYNPLMRYILESGRAIPIDRSKKDKSALKEALKFLKNGEVIGIYPEGGRSLAGKIQKGKTGVARLALWAKVPVVPVGIKGAFEILPKGKMMPKFKKSIAVNIGKPIYFSRYYNRKITKKLLRTITKTVMKNIANLAGQEYVG